MLRQKYLYTNIGDYVAYFIFDGGHICVLLYENITIEINRSITRILNDVPFQQRKKRWKESLRPIKQSNYDYKRNNTSLS